MSAGYSGTPLAKKLGLKQGLRCAVEGYYGDYATMVEFSVELVQEGPLDFVHLFCVSQADLDALTHWRKQITPSGMIWVSWPKKASKVPTELDENKIRDFGLTLGLVDVKVCAVDAVWSGLKFVWPVVSRLSGKR